MKIGKKYSYYTRYKEPFEKDFSNKNDFITALSEYKLLKTVASAFLCPQKLKSYKKRYPKNKIETGATIFIERWDSNGIDDEVKVVGIDQGLSRIIVKCNKGWFIFSKWNCKNKDIDFHWTCSGKKWQKEYMKWINGNRYYYEDK